MKRILLFVGLALLCLLALPVFAQDVDPTVEGPVVQNITVEGGGTANITPSGNEGGASSLVSDDILNMGLIILGGIFLLILPRLMGIVGNLLPAGAVKDIIAEIVPAVADAILARTAATPSHIDDALAIATLRANGYTVTRDESGHHTQPYAKPSDSPITAPYPPAAG
jgi:hypothetical protein